ncbi:putative auxin efflux carrier component 4 [Dichanthelium oligosanthes]|uniref:Putative auxin efflux carrier component 4 n=1 Tax=Dichanthelium oligosanthes TaxID=888268 RepID=A0A1E5UI56_9POAL|nr:putative auxin efflux carrier component 4 [Dichanthelium oligosanthes]
MAPLYFALALGYGSVRRWKLFTPDQCGAINRLVIYFAFPFFGFDLAARSGSFAASYRVLAADVACKALVVLALAGWAAACRWSRKSAGGRCSYSWCITGFSLAALNNALLMGIPLLDAMYGEWAQDIAVQMAMMQIVVWFPLLLVVFEARQAWLEMPPPLPAVASAEAAADGALEEYGCAVPETQESGADESGGGRKTRGWSFWAPLLRTVALKLAYNPNVYASLLGVAWSSIANRWHLELPSIVEGSVTIMSKTGIGLGMFSMGLFIALQEKFIMCGAGLTALSLVLRFVAGPAAAAAAAAVLGLRGDLLRFAIVQAALPQSVATFNFAREYDLHADLLSTAIIVGTLASLPVLIAYYLVLGLIR